MIQILNLMIEKWFKNVIFEAGSLNLRSCDPVCIDGVL